ncbi:phage_rel_nuc, putative phage-type endonuclease [uncultured Caudovirales phage]|uniref:Phage_rel_nuc, putative phage-type endonuclease n=1 Tax=uncultured Caudovirales phage TaxID=2100421 RepID=A0A6J5KHW8_9CAUD|nr:phage_rel_nuc, putative phage-type endonuclease [uncultured Caudovirales phage]
MTDNPFDLNYAGPDNGSADDYIAEAASKPAVVYHDAVVQGSDEWLQMRCGLITASEMRLILTPTLKVANNDKTRAHAYELAFQRLTQFVEPQYVSDAMLRGQEDEIYARAAYAEHFAPVQECGFITRDFGSFMIGYSPDGLVGDDGLIECKSRAGKYQVQTIATNEVPEEYVLQLQTGLLVTGRAWIDFISYCGGLPVFIKRVEPDAEVQDAILSAAEAFNTRVVETMREYHHTLANMRKVIPTERREIEEIIL